MAHCRYRAGSGESRPDIIRNSVDFRAVIAGQRQPFAAVLKFKRDSVQTVSCAYSASDKRPDFKRQHNGWLSTRRAIAIPAGIASEKGKMSSAQKA